MVDAAKLTKSMERALQYASENDGVTTAYRSHVSTATMWALSKRGLMEAFGAGHMAFPSTATWRLTPAGRALLRSIEGGER